MSDRISLYIKDITKANNILLEDNSKNLWELQNVDSYEVSYTANGIPTLTVKTYFQQNKIDLRDVIGGISSEKLMQEIMKRGFVECVREYRSKILNIL